VAFVSITLAAITGTINSILDVGGFGELWSTGYGRTLVLKIGVFIGILALGALNHFVIRDRIAKESSAAEGDGARARATFRKTIVFEVALALAVLGLTAILTGLAPPGDRPAAVAPEGPNSRTAAPSPTYFLQ
jgi:putative copper export protein